MFFSESTVIYDIDFHTIYDATLIAADISHLISHLWCGDLVTMEWWTELFLADGLAYYYQEKGVSIVSTELFKRSWALLVSTRTFQVLQCGHSLGFVISVFRHGLLSRH